MSRPAGYKHTEETKRKIRDKEREFYVKNPKERKYQHILTKEFLEREYVANYKPIRQIAKETGISNTCIIKTMKHYGIPRRPNNPYHQNGNSHNFFHRVAYITLNLPKVCSLCGSTEQVHVHHRNMNRGDNSLDNLVIVCNSCHQTVFHHGLAYLL